eukprot:gnl/Dysnectes_brevis/2547_a3065_1075.p1 GENE.gnl/Dysnectes_brevis/2547_a3065_1075~~gnl/Dysnectes_brevis/2547_a3065_1075.p1  ORF type:complete len:556 (-),score=194.62 gnl/Dysnectes_brevis/2547_a3065_1075:86-1753(-)
MVVFYLRDLFVNNYGLQNGMATTGALTILSIPVSFLIGFVPSSNKMFVLLRHLISFVLGLFVISLTYGFLATMLNSFIPSLFYYLAMKYMPSKHMLPVVFALSFGHLVCYHAYTQLITNANADGWDIDYSGPLMIICIRITSLAWNIRDHDIIQAHKRQEDEKVEATEDEEDKPSLIDQQYSKLNKHHRMSATATPALIPYLGHVFFFPNAMYGPGIEFHRYESWADGSQLREALANAKTGNKGAMWVSRLLGGLQALPTLALGLFWLFYFQPRFPATRALEPSFRELTLLKRVLWFIVYRYGLNGRYLFAWGVSDTLESLMGSGCQLVQKGDSEHTDHFAWHLNKNIIVQGLEMGGSMHSVVKSWNVQTAIWLRHYVYERMTPSRQLAKFATVGTNLVSAMWHGLQPGYYLFFGILAFVGIVSNNVHKTVTPVVTYLAARKGLQGRAFKLVEAIYNVLAWFIPPWFISYGGLAFDLLSIRASLRAQWNTLRFGPWVLTAVLMCVPWKAVRRALGIRKVGREYVYAPKAKEVVVVSDGEKEPEPVKEKVKNVKAE